MDQPLIALVEDDVNLRTELAQHLQRYGFRTHEVTDFHDLTTELLTVVPDLVLLDVTLPAFDGFYWCRRIRRVSTVPIMFLTARDGDMDQVLALEYGADDLLSKPINPDLLIARIRSLLRRSIGEYQQTSAMEVRPGVTWEQQKLQLTHPGGVLDLTRNENMLLGMFLQAGGAVLTREQLLDALWDDTVFVDDNTLSVNINRLRKRLAEAGLPDAIRTVRGVGYRFGVEPS